jgi:hypothetical protein
MLAALQLVSNLEEHSMSTARDGLRHVQGESGHDGECGAMRGMR